MIKDILILAAGTGSRLRPYTKDKPKCLVEISNQSLLERQIDVLNNFSFRKVLIAGGYKYALLEKFSDELIVNYDYESTNMVWSLKCAEEYLNHELILSYGDIVFSKEILKKLIASESDISVVVDMNWEDYWKLRNDDYLSDAETLRMIGGKIIEIGGRPNSIEDIEAQYIGLIKFSLKGLEILKEYLNKEELLFNGKSIKEAYMTDLLQQMILDGVSINAVPIYSPWVEIDTVSDLELEENISRIQYIHNEISV